MTATASERQRELHTFVSDYLHSQSAKKEKTDKKSAKTHVDELEVSETAAVLLSLPEIQAWVRDAATKMKQLKMATHLLKATHPYAKGTNVLCQTKDMPECDCVSTKHTGSRLQDVVGNAACLGFYGFLMMEFKGSTILELIEAGDSDLAQVFADDLKESEQIFKEFLAVKTSQQSPTSHTFTKQLYWLVEGDPLMDSNYHILAPQYSSVLAQFVYEIIQEDRFGVLAKQAREAKKQKMASELIVKEYPNLAVQKLGGSKPQNISKLNSNRSGTNYLLASCPPIWNQRDVYPIFGRQSYFDGLERRREVKDALTKLKEFLEGDPSKNKLTRDTRESLLCNLIDEIQLQTSSLLSIEPGWTKDDRCELNDSEKLWLDPERCSIDETFAALWRTIDWRLAVSRKFGAWLNTRLKDKLEMSDAEFKYWSDSFFEHDIFA